MRGSRRWSELVLAMIAVAGSVTHAAAKEPPPACTPPCQPSETCVGSSCMVPSGRPQAPAPAFPPPAQSAPPPALPPPAPGAPVAPIQPAPPPAYPAYPAYPAQPGYRPLPPPGAYDMPIKPMRQRRFLLLPYIGTHSYQSDAESSYFPGFRLGAMLGGRVNEDVSLNWEMTFDVSNIDTAPMAPSSSEYAFDFAFSPMGHFLAGPVELVVGPKLGVFWVHAEVHSATTYTSETHQGTGILGGLTVGTFMAVSTTTSLGVLLSAEVRKIEHACNVNVGEIALCNLSRDDAAKLVGVTAAALFR
jgi:hypothetical protein